MITNDEINCPECGGVLKHYDKVERIVRTVERTTRHVKIRRLRCCDCRSVHRKLPSYVLPYKQYEKDIILGILEGLITCETLGYEDYPCEMTMNRWIANESQIISLANINTKCKVLDG